MTTIDDGNDNSGFTSYSRAHPNGKNGCASLITSDTSLAIDIITLDQGTPSGTKGSTTELYTSGVSVYARAVIVRRATGDTE